MFLLIIQSKEFMDSTSNYFNTSHVSINHALYVAGKNGLGHFNTSHVSINLMAAVIAVHML